MITPRLPSVVLYMHIAHGYSMNRFKYVNSIGFVENNEDSQLTLWCVYAFMCCWTCNFIIGIISDSCKLNKFLVQSQTCEKSLILQPLLGIV